MSVLFVKKITEQSAQLRSHGLIFFQSDDVESNPVIQIDLKQAKFAADIAFKDTLNLLTMAAHHGIMQGCAPATFKLTFESKAAFVHQGIGLIRLTFNICSSFMINPVDQFAPCKLCGAGRYPSACCTVWRNYSRRGALVLCCVNMIIVLSKNIR